MAGDRSETTRVLISGLGPVTSIGLGLDSLADGMAELAVLKGSEHAEGGAAQGVRLVPDFDLRQLTGRRSRDLDFQSQCVLAAGALALDSAAVEPDEVDPSRCGLALASALGDLQMQAALRDALAGEGACRDVPFSFPRFEPRPTDGILSREFSLQGANEHFCGSLLCGAEALSSALQVLRSDGADLVLCGGADVGETDLLGRLAEAGAPGGPTPGQGAALLVLETQDSVERREGYAFCELLSVVCAPTGSGEWAEALHAAIAQTMQQARIWEGDIGVVFLSSGSSYYPDAARAEREALEAFSQVPVLSGKRYAGETFGAGFPLECTLAADVLSNGHLPPKVTFQGKGGGVEFWIERQPEPLLGTAALVVGCTPEIAAAAVLRNL